VRTTAFTATALQTAPLGRLKSAEMRDPPDRQIQMNTRLPSRFDASPTTQIFVAQFGCVLLGLSSGLQGGICGGFGCECDSPGRASPSSATAALCLSSVHRSAFAQLVRHYEQVRARGLSSRKVGSPLIPETSDTILTKLYPTNERPAHAPKPDRRIIDV
jgi:hypothetical protein